MKIKDYLKLSLAQRTLVDEITSTERAGLPVQIQYGSRPARTLAILDREGHVEVTYLKYGMSAKLR